MTVPGFGPMPLSGFTHSWLFVFGLVPIALLALYVLGQFRRRQRLNRFADRASIDSVSPRRPSPWRHLPTAVMLVALLMLSVALAGPTHDVQVPRNRAVIMLVIDVSPSMNATDVAPTRLAAARQAAAQFATQLTPGVNLGLIAFAGTVNVLVSPTPQHEATVAALDHLHTDPRTATGAAIFAALQSVATVGAVISGAEGTPPPPARIVLLSDGKENDPANPDAPQGAYTAARAAMDQGIPVSTIAFGTTHGVVEMNHQNLPVPVDTAMMTRIAALSGGQPYTATNVDELTRSYDSVEQQIGYQHVPGPASAGWLRLAVLTATVAVLLALLVNRRLPT